MPVFDAGSVMAAESYGLDDETARVTATTNSRIDAVWWKRWEANFEANESAVNVYPALSSLYGDWNDRPCIVAGAGPSMRGNVRKIARAQEEGWRVVAVDRAFNFLKRAGVRPDVTLSSDASSAVAGFFDKRLLDSDDRFALCVITHPRVYAKLRGSGIFVYACANPFSEFWRYVSDRCPSGTACVRPGFVVTFSAVDFALWMGANPIVTVGNELSWREDEKVERCYEGTHMVALPGGRVTLTAFLKASRAFRFFPGKYPDVLFADASDGIVHGWERVEMEEVVKRFRPRVKD